ncbi:hypothetical protein EZV62_006085 [Acer yangbiense]|uniref:UBC core domain-containing protein n=1 Tax=Acer yangbiense TaxID=1000413 RepID=A0A5C7IPG8_9ROSI|nr:hypothetical protein EZV62_006085 [Acer yangbiense]
MAEDKYNMKNPAVKRIMQEVKEMQSNPSDDFMSLPLEDNLFEWQFAIRGPQHRQPSWSLRTALVALIAFIPTNPNGALGSLDYKKEERRALTIKSRQAAPKYGTPDQSSEEPSSNSEIEAPANSQDAEGVVTREVPSNSEVGERIIEEVQEVPDNANPNPTGVRASREVSAKARDKGSETC